MNLNADIPVLELNTDIAVGHAAALARNYQTAYPNSSSAIMADYVASEMVGFVKRAPTAHDVADDYDAWYAHAMLNFGGTL